MTSFDNNTMIKYVSHLLCLIEARNWTAFEAIAVGNPHAFQLISNQLSKCPEFNGMTFLHACVRNNPPLRIVAHMIELCPDLTGARDCLNRTPLHVAAGSGANASLVKLLAQACPSACDVQDEDGMTPLHYACDSSCELFEDDENDEPREPPSYDVVRALLSASLYAATLEDEEGMNALEYAIISDAPIKVVQLLQKATQMSVKKEKLNSAPADHVSPSSSSRIQRRCSVGAASA